MLQAALVSLVLLASTVAVPRPQETYVVVKIPDEHCPEGVASMPDKRDPAPSGSEGPGGPREPKVPGGKGGLGGPGGKGGLGGPGGSGRPEGRTRGPGGKGE